MIVVVISQFHSRPHGPDTSLAHQFGWDGSSVDMFRSQFFVKIWRHITFVQEAPMKHLLARVLALTGLPLFCQIPKGHIKGTVTDQNGNPVASATVYAATDFEGITLFRKVK